MTIANPDQIRALNDEPLYWIHRHAYHDFAGAIGDLDHSLIGYEANNGGRYRWCSYDNEGKEYVEWDSAVADTNTAESSAQSVANLPQVEWMDLINLVERAMTNPGPERVLTWLVTELTYRMGQMKLTSERSQRLLKQLRKFDPEAALELSK